MFYYKFKLLIMDHVVKIKEIHPVTHDVRKYTIERPDNFEFNPGQATDVSINNEQWKKELRPFTFTSLKDSKDLEFVIKSYNDRNGVTAELYKLVPGDELIIRDSWGAIEYKGPGYFLAGGAGITPFIAILRDLKSKNELDGNKLFFSNKTEDDIILHDELSSMLGPNVVYAITDEESPTNYHGYINEDFLKKYVDDFSKHFYLCGPPKMIEVLTATLKKLGANPESVVFEK